MNHQGNIDVSILVVDDKTENIDLLHQVLKYKGYRVAGVPSGKLALELAPKIEPDLILLDVMMPEMDGFETCRRLKQIESLKDTPILFVTAKTEPNAIAAGFSCGAVDYISKPIKEEEVWARIDNHITISRLSREKNQLIEQLRELEKRNRTIIDKASDAMITVASPGIIESANPAALHLTGMTQGEILGYRFIQLLQQPYALDYATVFDYSTKTSHDLADGVAREVIINRADGTSIAADLSIIHLDLDDSLFLCLLHDLTLHQNLVKELRRISHVDKLTNLANRRRFDDVFLVESRRCRRTNQPLSLLFIDIDNFKEYNDYYGHSEGDDCLREVARSINQIIARPSDLVARYGGEEFVAVLPDTDQAGALAVAENLRQSINRLHIRHEALGAEAFLTISVGIASGIPRKDHESLLLAADKALYQAKHNGKNTVVVGSL